MKSIENKEKGISIQATQEVMYYLAMPGNNSDGTNQASGAYIFRPNGTTPLPVHNGTVEVKVVKVRVGLERVSNQVWSEFGVMFQGLKSWF